MNLEKLFFLKEKIRVLNELNELDEMHNKQNNDNNLWIKKKTCLLQQQFIINEELHRLYTMGKPYDGN